MSDKQHPVSIPSKKWHAQQNQWDLTNTLWGGTEAMRDAGKVYLPQEPAEPETAYFNRLSRSVLTPVYPDSIKKLMGKIMKQPVVLEDDVQPAVLKYMDDVDSQGTDINEWTKTIGETSMNHGVTFILVDSPNNQPEDPEDRMMQDAVLRGEMRPYAVHIKAPQIIGWKTETIGGQVMLTQVRILHSTEEDSLEDEFTQETVLRIHVWELVPQFDDEGVDLTGEMRAQVRVFRKIKDSDGNEDWVLESTRMTDLDFIPLIGIYSNKIELMVGKPPMLDVAHLNVTHWQSDSDQRNILHVARVPLLFGSGLGDDERGDFQVQIGPNTMTRGPQGSDMKFVEHSGKGIEAGQKDLEILESRMKALALNMIIKRQPGDVTATARAIDASEADSPLGLFARELEAGLEKMLDLFAFFLDRGEDAGGSVTLFKDFSISQRDADDIKALADMRVRGDISQQTYWAELKRRGLLNDDFDPEEEIDLLDLEFQDSQAGLTEAELQSGNQVGDETEEADGHTHILQEGGYTNIVDGHKHKWEPTGATTSTDDDHFHGLKGVEDGRTISRQGQQETGTPSAGAGGPAGGNGAGAE